MTEQHTSQNDASRPAPIDQVQERKRRTYSLPKATRPSPSTNPELFDGYADDLNRTALGQQMLVDATRALAASNSQMNDVADAEDAIIKSENERVAAGGDPGNIRMINGKATPTPTQYDELAQAAEPALDKAIVQIEERIQKHYRLQISILNKMSDALVDPVTARDHTLMGQIRDHMTKLGKVKAMHFATKAAMDGDLPAIHTILSSPHYLSSLDAKDIGKVREAANKALSPDLNRAYEVGLKIEKSMALAKKGLVEKRDTINKYRVHSQKNAADALSKLKKLK
ncbi:MAG: hypothetical protein AAGF25_13215 [Pseudomonadota bacterium]